MCLFIILTPKKMFVKNRKKNYSMKNKKCKKGNIGKKERKWQKSKLRLTSVEVCRPLFKLPAFRWWRLVWSRCWGSCQWVLRTSLLVPLLVTMTTVEANTITHVTYHLKCWQDYPHLLDTHTEYIKTHSAYRIVTGRPVKMWEIQLQY